MSHKLTDEQMLEISMPHITALMDDAIAAGGNEADIIFMLTKSLSTTLIMLSKPGEHVNAALSTAQLLISLAASAKGKPEEAK